jgi:hypothetical protein
MPKKHLRILTHYGSSESIALIRPKIVMFIPTSANQFFEVVARIDSLVLGREIVEDFGGGMDASGGEADTRIHMWFLRTIHL